jgi:magnesium and cobalt transporter
LDDGSDRSGIWQRLSKLFHGRRDVDTVERAIRDASKDGELDKEEGSMLLNVLSLDELQVRDIMTPRTDIICAPEESGIREAAELIMATGHSRLPVFSGNRDNIIGILHTKDLLEHMLNPPEQALPISRLMREPFFTPETKNILDLLHEFRAMKQHLAVIVDEYGGTAGLVTIEDVIEQIVGDIEDEHDAPREEEISLQPDGSYLIAGRAYLEDLEETLGLKISSDEVDTLGGHLTHLAGRVPAAGDTFTLEELDGVVFTVIDADVKQIRTVRMLRPSVTQGVPAEKNAGAIMDEAAPQAVVQAADMVYTAEGRKSSDAKA